MNDRWLSLRCIPTLIVVILADLTGGQPKQRQSWPQNPCKQKKGFKARKLRLV